MSLTKKISSYLCAASMVFSLNVKSDALVKEILQVPGIMFEFIVGAMLLREGTKLKNKYDTNKINKNEIKNGMPQNVKCVKVMKNVGEAACGLFFLFDAVQRTFFLMSGDSNSKTEKADNKELNKKNEKKVENA